MDGWVAVNIVEESGIGEEGGIDDLFFGGGNMEEARKGEEERV